MIKLFGCVVVLVACAWMGQSLYAGMQKSLAFTDGMIGGLTYLLKDISFSRPFLAEGLQSASTFAGTAAEVFLCAGQALSDKGVVTCDAWKSAIDKATWCDDEVYIVLDELGRQLGRTDIQGEIGTITGCIEKLKLCRTKQQEALQTKGKLYKKGGVLLGMTIVILFV